MSGEYGVTVMISSTTFKSWSWNKYARVMKRRMLATYLGLPISNQEAETGKYREGIWLQYAQCDHRLRPHLTAKGMIVPPPIYWTRGLQYKALDHGFFFHRSWPHNRVNILSTGMALGLDIPGDPFNIDGDASLAQLERLLFADQDEQDFYCHDVFPFIVQQDCYGYSNVWEHCDLYGARRLEWYRSMKSFAGKSVRDEQLRARANARVAQVKSVGFKRGHTSSVI